MEQRISNLEKKISIEQKCKIGAENMLKQLSHPNAIQECKLTIAESDKRLQFLYSELAKCIPLEPEQEEDLLELQGMELQETSSVRFKRNSEPGPSLPYKPLYKTSSMSIFTSILNTLGLKSYKSNSSLELQESASPNPTMTILDYWKSHHPLSRDKIQFKLSEIQSRLINEQKVYTGTEAMIPLLNGTNKEFAQDKLMESQSKVLILEKSRVKYKGLCTDDLQSVKVIHDEQVQVQLQSEERVEAEEIQKQLEVKEKTFSGKLFIKLISCSGIPGKKYHHSEVYTVFKIDGIQKVQSKPSKGKWNEEISIYVDKAKDLEIAVYEKNGSCLALLWFPFASLAQELIELARSKGALPVDLKLQDLLSTSPRGNDVIIPINILKSRHDGLDGHFDLEPSGRIHLFLKLESQYSENRSESGVVRRKPVQKVFPKRGHKFTPIQSYQVMKCAICNEFVLNSQAYQCLSCNFTCHKKCQSRVITNCIAKLGDEADEEQDLISNVKHRIPHRFQLNSNLTVSWCCHCGSILTTLSKRPCYKCTECNATCHKDCAPLVPHFCGLSAELIDQVRMAVEATDKLRKDRLSKTTLSLANNIQQEVTKRTQSRLTRKESLKAYQDVTRIGIGLQDFDFLAVLGKGNFGKVLLAQEKYTKQLYAIKVLKKDFILENDEVESTKCEKRIFLTANLERHPFLVNLHSSFQTESRLFFVMEYVSGGDLMWHIQQQPFSERRARFYAAEVLLALEYFHKHNIIYRDLKLDNILLTLDGHVKIADYGLCKENMYHGATTSTFCGTPEFMAPDILLEKPYTRAVDWWAFGILTYEMLLGQSPFKCGDEDEIFHSILHDEIMCPISLPKDAVSLLQQLLNKDPNKRLGSGPTDAQEIKQHEFFKDVDWQALLELKVVPPFFPTIHSPTDISNFDIEFTRELPVLTPCNSILSSVDQEQFRGFSCISDWAQQVQVQL